MIASGVRSSCEASATKRRCDAKATSSRASIESNVSASRFSSSSGPSSSIRRDSSAAWISRATCVMCAIGASTLPAITQPTARLATKSAASAPSEKLRRLRSVRSFTCRSKACASTKVRSSVWLPSLTGTVRADRAACESGWSRRLSERPR